MNEASHDFVDLFVVGLQLSCSLNQLLRISYYELKEGLIIGVIDIGICGIIFMT